VLNPAAARGRDGELYLFPRLVAEGNYSRIGRARVRFDDGRPDGVERLGVALEPVDLQPAVRYCAGAMLLDPDEVWRVTARSPEPLLEPETGEDVIVPDVVFPTALDARADGKADVYYGMADSRIGVARLIHTG
jgi:beta-1,4-mannooligosaccharide phosphorylase